MYRVWFEDFIDRFYKSYDKAREACWNFIADSCEYLHCGFFLSTRKTFSGGFVVQTNIGSFIFFFVTGND